MKTTIRKGIRRSLKLGNSNMKSIGGNPKDAMRNSQIPHAQKESEIPSREGRTKLTHHQTDAHRCVKLIASCRFGSLRLAVRKGAIHVDYVLAVGLFLVAFAFVMTYTTDYYSTVKETAAVMEKRSGAISLLSMAERSPEPEGWPELQANESIVLLMHLNNNTLDYSGQGNNGTISGANCSSSVWGRFFSGCSFDGVNDYISLTRSTINNSLNFTAEAWININDTSSAIKVIYADRISGGDGSGNYFSMRIAGSNFSIEVYDYDASNQVERSSNTSAADGNWHHVAAAINDDSISLYVDGDLKASHTYNHQASGANNQGSVGARYTNAGAATQFFNGTIDEVAIYNRTLSAAEIKEHYRQSLNRIGLHTYAYRLYIKVNNTLDYRVNKTVNSTNVENELVSFNLTEVFGGADKFSVAVYDDNGSSVPYQISDENITFVANASINSTRWYTVYFDDDSLFPDSSAAVSGTNNLTETIASYERIDVLQYEKIRQLNSSGYSSVKNSSGTENNFNVQIYDTLTNTTFEDFGGTAPGKGDIIALERYVVFQNSTAGIRQGKIIVKVW